jgi:predicted chitinase
MKRIKKRHHRSQSEIRALVAGYENGNQSRAAYCAAHGLALTTLDDYRRRVRTASAPLVEIDLQSAALAPAGKSAVVVVLGNGRRVEIGWADLALVPGHSQPLRTLLGWLEEA